MRGPEAGPPIPRDAEGAPVFAAPWEAQAFAMVVALHDRGVFSWSEWARALGTEIAATPKHEHGYYGNWLTAAEALLASKGIAAASDLAARRDAFDRAARATPHGQPIHLQNDPLRGR